MDLSIVIPVYRGASFVADRLSYLSSYMVTTGIDYEILPVDDGSPDETAKVLASLNLPRVRPILGEPHRGKFGTIAAGMKKATGRCRLFTDADIPFELAAIPYFAWLVNHRGIHIAIGDRTMKGSVYRTELGPVRKAATWIFAQFVRHIVTGDLEDTQCGLKAIRGDVADALFDVLKEDGFAGDVELLYVALKHKLEIKRVPVRLQQQGESTVRPFRHAFEMLKSLIRIRLRYGRGEYSTPAIDAVAAQDYWHPNFAPFDPLAAEPRQPERQPR